MDDADQLAGSIHHCLQKRIQNFEKSNVHSHVGLDKLNCSDSVQL